MHLWLFAKKASPSEALSFFESFQDPGFVGSPIALG
jgi:hypothetical protein